MTTRHPLRQLEGRQPLAWPRGARLALWVVLNVESFDKDSLKGPAIAGQPASLPDVANSSWRDYGNRVGIWRITQLLDDLGIPATLALNSDVCAAHPEIAAASTARDWEIMGHGQSNDRPLSGLTEAAERAVISGALDRVQRATGVRPSGWLSPGLAETERTQALLAELGVTYFADLVQDDQPCLVETPSGRLVSVPYSLEVNDFPTVLRWGMTGAEFARLVLDQFDVLYEESSSAGLVMCVALHPFITGAPHRFKHLRTALEQIASTRDVWFTTGSGIAGAYLQWHEAQEKRS